MNSPNRSLAALLLAMTMVSCGDLPPMVSDTGYRGTWSRSNQHNISIVSITDVGGRWFFRWTKRTYDGQLTILCDWDGRCEERLKGKLTATYTMTTRYDVVTGKLYTDTVETRRVPGEQVFRYTDVMEVTDGGRTLWNFTTDRDGQHYEGGARPMRSFRKIANSVADPPRVDRR
jgi:hypothetical protein